MTVMLTLIFLILVVAAAAALGRRSEGRGAARTGGAAGLFRPEDFPLPGDRAYHPAHTWAREDGDRRVTVGVDRLAIHALGPPEALSLPDPGERVVQGRSVGHLRRGAEEVPLLSPVSGEVAEINPRVLREPVLLARSPETEGWLMRVRPETSRASLRNLMRGAAARCWRQENVARLNASLWREQARVAADGGDPVFGLLDRLSSRERRDVLKSIFRPAG